MKRFLIDEDLPRSTTHALREAGFETQDVRDVGLRGKTDEAVYDYAQRQRLTIVTADRGFGNISRFPLGKHCGIVVLRPLDEIDVAARNSSLVAAVKRLQPSDLLGNVIVVREESIRIRRL